MAAVELVLLPELRFKGTVVEFWPPYSRVTSLPLRAFSTLLTQMMMMLNFLTIFRLKTRLVSSSSVLTFTIST